MNTKDIFNNTQLQPLQKIAITGATGFIGRYVLTELLQYPVKVIPIIHKTPLDTSHTHWLQIDLSKEIPANLEAIGNPDTLVHLAWAGLPNYSSLHHFEEELHYHYQFLKNMITSGLTSLVITGTCFEYGMQSGALHEDMITLPQNPYGFAKDRLRHQLEFLKLQHPFNLTWARLFYLYGIGQNKSSLFAQLNTAVKDNDPIFNMSAGEQLRDYLSVTEVAKYIALLAVQSKDIGIMNICSGNPISVRRIVETWIIENNWSIKLNLGYYPYSLYEPMAFWGSREKLNNFLKSI